MASVDHLSPTTAVYIYSEIKGKLNFNGFPCNKYFCLYINQVGMNVYA